MTKTGVLNLMVKLQKGLLMVGRTKIARLEDVVNLKSSAAKTELMSLSIPANTIKAGALLETDITLDVAGVNATPGLVLSIEYGAKVLATMDLQPTAAAVYRLSTVVQFTTTGSAAEARVATTFIVTAEESAAGVVLTTVDTIPSVDSNDLKMYLKWSAAHASNEVDAVTGFMKLLPQ
jgi:hypothetical protein